MSKTAQGAAAPTTPTTPETKAHSHGPTTTQGPSKGKQTFIDGHCHAADCKSNSTRFDFCSEHFDQFKFGLIKKTGELVSDYEKKFEHYQAYKAKLSARKAA
jgi:hypothetical protein